MVIAFFRSISHQLYGTEDGHPQIRALAIQHLINSPEHFVEYNTHQSWLQYLQSMSRLGTWADHIIIQAVANASNLRINITESEPNFSESTTISSIYAESETHRRSLRDIYVGHLEELHYVSTTPIRPTTQSISPEITYQTTSDKPKAISQNSEPNKTSSQEPVTTKDLEKRKKYMKEYMKERRKDQVFKKKKLKEKSHIIKTIKIQIRKKLKNHGKNPLLLTENQIQRRLRNHLKILQHHNENQIQRRLRNHLKILQNHTEN